MAKVKLSTDKDLKEESSFNLKNVKLQPGQAVLLKFPYKAWRWRQTNTSFPIDEISFQMTEVNPNFNE